MVHKPGGPRRFKATSDGLYMMEVNDLMKPVGRAFLQTVKDNKQGYSKRAILRAKKAKEFYGIVQYPSIRDFKEMLRHNLIKNCPVKVEDVDNMINIYGPSVAALNGQEEEPKGAQSRLY